MQLRIGLLQQQEKFYAIEDNDGLPDNPFSKMNVAISLGSSVLLDIDWPRLETYDGYINYYIYVFFSM